MEKIKTIYPLYTLYTGGIISLRRTKSTIISWDGSFVTTSTWSFCYGCNCPHSPAQKMQGLLQNLPKIIGKSVRTAKECFYPTWFTHNNFRNEVLAFETRKSCKILSQNDHNFVHFRNNDKDSLMLLYILLKNLEKCYKFVHVPSFCTALNKNFPK